MPVFQPNQFKEVLAEVVPGSVKSLARADGKSPSKAKQILDDNGLSLEDCAAEMRNLLHYADDQSLKMKVVDTALKIHGALTPEATNEKDISIQFVFQNENQSIGMQILVPR